MNNFAERRRIMLLGGGNSNFLFKDGNTFGRTLMYRSDFRYYAWASADYPQSSCTIGSQAIDTYHRYLQTYIIYCPTPMDSSKYKGFRIKGNLNTCISDANLTICCGFATWIGTADRGENYTPRMCFMIQGGENVPRYQRYDFDVTKTLPDGVYFGDNAVYPFLWIITRGVTNYTDEFHITEWEMIPR